MGRTKYEKTLFTIKDIALIAGVSTATVSNVLNGRSDQVSPDTLRKVMKVIRETNYQPNRIAKSLRTSQTQTIGVIAEDITAFNTPSIINGISQAAERFQYHLILNDLGLRSKIGNRFADIANYRRAIDYELSHMLSMQIDGIIYVGHHPRDVTGIVPYTTKPLVYVGCYTDDANQIAVTYDDEKATFELTRMLLQLGHRKIGLISGPYESPATQARNRGFKRAIREAGIVFCNDQMRQGDWEYESGLKYGLELLREHPSLTAIVAMNDVMAVGAMRAALECKISVPEDLSIVGFDDQEISKYTVPGLTTVRLPLKEIGYEGALSVLGLVEGRQVVSRQVGCEIVVRQSALVPLLNRLRSD